VCVYVFAQAVMIVSGCSCMFHAFIDILHIDCVVVGRCVIVAWCRAWGCSVFTHWPTYCDSGEKGRI